MGQVWAAGITCIPGGFCQTEKHGKKEIRRAKREQEIALADNIKDNPNKF